MSSISRSEGSGNSKESPDDAVINAIQEAMAEAEVNGDHMNSITIEMAQVEYDGEKWVATVYISVQDHNLEQEDIYHETEEEVEQRREVQDDMASAFFVTAGVPGTDITQPEFERTQDLDERYEGLLNQSEVGGTMQFGGENGNDIIMYATPEAAEQIREEVQKEKLEAKLAHENNGAPGLDLGGGSSGHKEEAA